MGFFKMKQSLNRNENASGNALFLILVAIALIAALTIAVTRSDVSDSDATAPEQARIKAGNILAQARNVEQAVQTLITRGCSEQTINFDNPIVAGYTNPDAPADDSCDIFQTAGAGLTWPEPIANANDGSDWMFLAGNAVGGVSMTDDGTCSSGCIDLIAVLPNVTEEVCQQVNILAGITSSATTPPVDTGNFEATTLIAGVDPAPIGEEILDAGNLLWGKRTGCFRPTNIDSAPASVSYWVYHVLLVR